MTSQGLHAMIIQSLNELKRLHRVEVNYIEKEFDGSNGAWQFLNDIRRDMQRCDAMIDECQKGILQNKLSKINEAA